MNKLKDNQPTPHCMESSVGGCPSKKCIHEVQEITGEFRRSKYGETREILDLLKNKLAITQ